EAEIALEKDIPVIPVLVGGAKLPSAEQLPEKLRVLTRLNVQSLRHETFDYDIGLVRKALRLSGGLRMGWVAAIAAVLLVAVSVGVLTQVPPGHPILPWPFPPQAQASVTPTDTPTALPTTPAVVTPTTPSLVHPPLANKQVIVGYSWLGNDHEVYIDATNHIWELKGAAGGPWHATDLTIKTQAPTPKPKALWAYAANDRESISYFDINGHVQDLYSSSSDNIWHNADLTARTNGPIANPTAISGILKNNEQEICYFDINGHVQDLYSSSSDSTWHNADLTARTNGPISNLTAINMYGANNEEEINYFDTNGHVQNLFLSLADGTWRNNDLTAITNANPAAVSGIVAVNGREISYFDTNGHVQVAYLSSSDNIWHNADLTARTNGPIANPTAISMYTTNNETEISYFDTSGQVQNVYISLADGIWRNNDLTAITNSPVAYPTAISRYGSSDEEKISFFDISGHLQLFHLFLSDGIWHKTDITDLSTTS